MPFKNSFRAKTVKEKSSENIKNFSKNKVLHTLVKPRSPQTIIFVEDIEDPWFIHVITYKTKSGVITDSSLIIKKDIDDRLTHLLHCGYEIVK